MFCEPALASVAGLALESVDQIDDVVEPAARAAANAASSNRDGQMGLAGTGAADQNSVASLGKEAAAGEIANERLVDRGAGELEVVEILGERQLGNSELVTDRTACFSLTSAVSRSPTMRWGSCWRLTAVAMISSKAAFMP